MEKICLNCNKPIVQRDNENMYRYTRRKYCSQACTHAHFRSSHTGWYSYFSEPAPELRGPIAQTDDEISLPETS